MATRTSRTITTIMATTTITATITAMTIAISPPPPVALPGGGDARTLAPVMAWFSPAFPTGSFAYSHGLEAAVAEGRVSTEAELLDWLQGVLRHGGGRSDGVLAACAIAVCEDLPALIDLAALAAALAPSAERLAESLAQGEAFVRAVREGWPELVPAGLPERVCHPIAAGAAAGVLGAQPELVLVAYLNGFAANLIAAAIRLGVCGQSAGARVLAALGPAIAELATRAAGASPEDLGGCAFGSDIAAMRHETLDGRLFLS